MITRLEKLGVLGALDLVRPNYYVGQLVSAAYEYTDIHIWDNPPDEEIRTIGVEAKMIMMYDINDQLSFTWADGALKALSSKGMISADQIYLVGNKLDRLVRGVLKANGMLLAANFRAQYFEISALRNRDVFQLVRRLMPKLKKADAAALLQNAKQLLQLTDQGLRIVDFRILGPPGSGKTSFWENLQATYEYLQAGDIDGRFHTDIEFGQRVFIMQRTNELGQSIYFRWWDHPREDLPSPDKRWDYNIVLCDLTSPEQFDLYRKRVLSPGPGNYIQQIVLGTKYDLVPGNLAPGARDLFIAGARELSMKSYQVKASDAACVQGFFESFMTSKMMRRYMNPPVQISAQIEGLRKVQAQFSEQQARLRKAQEEFSKRQAELIRVQEAWQTKYQLAESELMPDDWHKVVDKQLEQLRGEQQVQFEKYKCYNWIILGILVFINLFQLIFKNIV